MNHRNLNHFSPLLTLTKIFSNVQDSIYDFKTSFEPLNPIKQMLANNYLNYSLLEEEEKTVENTLFMIDQYYKQLRDYNLSREKFKILPVTIIQASSDPQVVIYSLLVKQQMLDLINDRNDLSIILSSLRYLKKNISPETLAKIENGVSL